MEQHVSTPKNKSAIKCFFKDDSERPLNRFKQTVTEDEEGFLHSRSEFIALMEMPKQRGRKYPLIFGHS